MTTRSSRPPNIETAERKDARLERERILAGQRAFLDEFDRQVENLETQKEKAR